MVDVMCRLHFEMLQYEKRDQLVQSLSYKIPIVTQDLYILLSVLGPIDQRSSNQ